MASPTWINKKTSTNAPVRYEELVSHSNYFWDKLLTFLGLTRTDLMVPVMKGKKLDLHRLFIEVTSRGGMEKVTKDKKWREVLRAVNVAAAKRTNGSFYLKEYYLKFLYEFEKLYYVETPVPSTQSKEAAGNDESQVGNEVEGVIDGKFDNGYLVTFKIGSQEMKGVLYEIPETPSQSEQPMEASSASNVPSTSHCRDEKKAKV